MKYLIKRLTKRQTNLAIIFMGGMMIGASAFIIQQSNMTNVAEAYSNTPIYATPATISPEALKRVEIKRPQKKEVKH